MGKQIEIKFGVLGGGSVAGESGREILSDIQSIVSQVEKNGATKLKFSMDTGSSKKQVDDLTESQLSQFKITEKQAQSTKSLADIKIKSLEAEENAIRKIGSAKERENRKEINHQLQINNILEQSRNYYDKYYDKIKKNAGLNEKWINFQDKLAENPNNFKSSTGARNDLKSLQRESRETGVEVLSLKDKLSNLFSQHLDISAVMVGIHLLQQGLQEVYQNVIQLDKAVTDLQIATGSSRKDTQNLVSGYSDLGKELGATTVQVADAANDWLRQGYSIKDTNILIKDTMMLSKLGQIDSAEATVALTSAMKGYGVSVEETEKIVDKFSAVDMKAAISAGDIATAMSQTATGARIAGVSIDKLTGYIAAVKEVTQDSAESIGVFYKTMFARMGNIKAGRLIDPETSEDLSDVESTLSGVGVKLRDSNDQFRNFSEVLDEVESKWNSYGTVQQRAIAVAFSGYRVA